MPEESRGKTSDTDQVLPDRSDPGDQSPDTRRELEAELQDAMEKTDLTREDFEQE
mgnify:CR=1 FL=1